MMHQHNGKHQQTGTALFLALFVVSLVVSLTIVWFMKNRIAIKHTQQMLVADQAYLYAQGMIDWAASILVLSATTTNTNQENTWPKLLPKTHLPDGHGFMSGRIDDYQTRINLNNLTDENTRKVFINLLSMLHVNIQEPAMALLPDAIIAWMTPINRLTSSAVAFDMQYLQYTPPYRAANRPLQSVSELRLIAGVTPALFNKLAPYLSTLPSNVKQHFKGAPPFIVSAYGESEEPESSSQSSHYYLVQANIEIDDLALVVYGLLYRTMTDKGPVVGIIWQGRGTV